MTPGTVGELLHWSYANLAMAHSAVSKGACSYGPAQFSVRSRLYRGLRDGTLKIGSLADDERLKMVLPQACCYCGEKNNLSVDHLIPRSRGGADSGDNLVWACRRCNSSKGARDALEWIASRDEFPPLLLLRRYLKLTINMAEEQHLMGLAVGEVADLPFTLAMIPIDFPGPRELRLWTAPL